MKRTPQTPRTRHLAHGALAIVFGCVLGTITVHAQTLPTGMQVVAGQASAQQSGNQLTITNSNNAILNWNSFSIGADSGVHFAQPGVGSQVLNRVTGNDPSAIFGSLSSNGRVWLLNPNGVLFGANARVDVGGLVASTLNLSNDDWLAGRFLFDGGESAAAIENQGQIRTTLGGQVALIGGAVSNEGAIEASGGQITLAAGRTVELVDTGAPNLSVKVTAPTGSAVNLDSLIAGRVDVIAAAVNQQGLIRAEKFATGPGGEILLQAGERLTVAQGSRTNADGSVGGSIKLLGREIDVQNGSETSANGADGGGTILVGGGVQGRDPTVPNADGVFIAPSASLSANALEHGDGGQIIVWSDVATRAYGRFSARGGLFGGNGGFVETSGNWLDARPALLDLAAPAGRAGTWLLDPYNITIDDSVSSLLLSPITAEFTAMTDDTVIPSSEIVEALNMGLNVVVSTGTGGSQAGTITIVDATFAGLAPTGDATLLLIANSDISMDSSTIINGGPNLLEVDFQAGQGGSGGIFINSSVIDTGNGNVTLGGFGPGGAAVGSATSVHGVRVQNSSLNAGTGTLSIAGRTGIIGGHGVLFTGVPSFLDAGDITIQGTAFSPTGVGVEILGGSLLATGELSITGTGSDGVLVQSTASNPTILSGNLGVSVTGTSNSITGIGVVLDATLAGLMTPALLQSSGGGAVINGSTNAAIAIYLRGTNNFQFFGDSGTTGAGDLTLTGSGGLLLENVSVGSDVNSLTATSSNNSIDISGGTLALSSMDTAVSLSADGVISLSGVDIQTTGGDVTLDGGPITITQFSQIATSGGNITLNGVSGGSAPGVSLTVSPNLNAGTGTLSITGQSGSGAGVFANLPELTAGVLMIDGTSTSGVGVDIDGGFVTASQTLSIAGDGGTDGISLFGDSSGTPLSFNVTAGITLGGTSTGMGRGVLISNASGTTDPLFASGGGDLSISGTNVSASAAAVEILGSGTAAFFGSSSAADLVLDATGGGLNLEDVSTGSNVSSLTATSDSTIQIIDGTLALSSTDIAVSLSADGFLFLNETEIVTSGGDATFTGDRISMLRAIITTNGGDITLDGVDAGSEFGVSLDLTELNAGTGALSVTGVSSDVVGVAGESPSLTAGDITITGTSDSGDGIAFFGGGFTAIGDGMTTFGTLTLTGEGGANGISLFGDDSDFTIRLLGAGGIFLDGTSTVAGTGVSVSVFDSVGAVAPVVFRTSVGGFIDIAGTSDTLALYLEMQDNTQMFGAPSSDVVGRVSLVGNGAGIELNNVSVLGDVRFFDIEGPSVQITDGTLSPSEQIRVFVDNVTLLGNAVLSPQSTSGTSLFFFGSGANGRAQTFFNDAGAGALVTAGSARWIIFLDDATDPDNLELDGLDYGFQRYGVQDIAEFAGDVGNGIVSFQSKSVTVTGTAVDKVYDGTTDAQVSGIMLTPEVAGDVVVTPLPSFTANFQDKNVADNIEVILNFSADPNFMDALGKPVYGYAFDYSVLTANIDKALLTGTVVGVNRAYDGTTDAMVAIQGLTGFVGNETVNLSGSGMFDNKNAGNRNIIGVSYLIEDGANGGFAGNYDFVGPATSSATINKAQLTAVVAGQNKTYDGTTDAVVNVFITGGLAMGEMINASGVGVFSDKNAGLGKDIAVSVYTLSDGPTGDLASNYEFTGPATTTASISRRFLFGNIAGVDKVYDGNTDAMVSVTDLDGLIGNETVNVSATGEFDDKNVGQDKGIEIGSYLITDGLNGGLADNYDFIGGEGPFTTASITPATLTGTVAGVDKVYDATRDAMVSVTGLVGLVAGETISASGSGLFGDKNVGQGKTITVGSYVLADGASGDLASNYNFAGPSTTSADITPAQLSGTVTAADKVYDATRSATVGITGLSGLVGGETINVSTTGEFDDKNVGQDKNVAIGPYVLANGATGDLASNYQFSGPTATTADITPAQLSATVTAQDKVYDATRDATVSITGLSGLVGGETINVSTTGEFDDKNVGQDKNVAIGPYVLANGATGDLASNYQFSGPTATTADITPATLTGAVTAADKVYDGTRDATVNVAGLMGLVGNETINVSASGQFDDKNVGQDKNVAVDYVLADGGNGGMAGNYQFEGNDTATADITPATLTGMVAGVDKVYDATRDAMVSVTGLSGLVAGETINVSGSGLFDDKNVGQDKTVTVGTYVLADGANGDLASNYNFAGPSTTTADITPAILTGAVSADDKVYDGNRNATLSVSGLSGLVGGETLQVSGLGTFDDKNVGQDKAVTVGSYVLADGANGGLASNYQFDGAAVTATTADITPATLTGTVGGVDKVYDATRNAMVSVTGLTGLVSGETINVSATGLFDDKNVGQDKNVAIGTYVLADGANGMASNYQFQGATSTTADITPAQLTGTVTAQDKVYDATRSATVGITGLSGLVGGETINVSTTGEFDDKNVGLDKNVAIGPYVLANGATGDLASNYQFSGPTATTADITPATLTYTSTPTFVPGGFALPVFSGSVDGFVADETRETATTGELAFLAGVEDTSVAGLFAINGSGLSATNYVFVQAEGNATALTIGVSEPGIADVQAQDSAVPIRNLRPVETPTQDPSSSGTVYLTNPSNGDSSDEGSTAPATFESVPLDELPPADIASMLDARAALMKDLLQDSLTRLETNPALADEQPCETLEDAMSGKCLVTEALKAQVAAAQVASVPAPAAPPAAAPDAAPAPPSAAAPPPVVAPVPSMASLLPPLFTIPKVKTAALPAIRRKVAVLIGVGQYGDAKIPALANAVGDGKAVGATLARELGYETLVLDNPSKQTIIATLNRLALEIGPEDSATIFYAGHGAVVESTGAGYWLVADSEAQNPESWLSNSDIARLIQQIGAKQVALISDSCYSGSLAGGQRIRGVPGELVPADVLARRSHVIMSSGGNEPVFDSGRDGHSVFAWSLMNTLSDLDGWRPGGNLFERIRFAVARALPQRPQYRAAPGYQEGGDYLFEVRELDTKPAEKAAS